jgi:hypothetical protein
MLVKNTNMGRGFKVTFFFKIKVILAFVGVVRRLVG